MTYLLDVNALVALGFQQHEFHSRLASWVSHANPPMILATCSITELGFARILTQASAYGFTLTQARSLLHRLKNLRPSQFRFITDNHDLSRLPAWVNAAKQITDGHLTQLARGNGCILATLDQGIPGAFLIPEM